MNDDGSYHQLFGSYSKSRFSWFRYLESQDGNKEIEIRDGQIRANLRVRMPRKITNERSHKMQELAEAVEASTEVLEHKKLTEAGVKWGEFVLRNFVGDHLKKAINISIAISEFTNLFEDEREQMKRK